MGKQLLIAAYALISIFLFATFATVPSVWLSFFASNLILFGVFYWHLYKEQEYAPFISVYVVFNFLFFIMAPILQLKVIAGKNADFMTKLPYDQSGIVLTNMLIAVFTIFFFIAYLLFKKTRKTRVIPREDKIRNSRLPLLIFITLGVTVFVFLLSFGFVREEMSRPSWMGTTLSTTAFLIWKKVLFLLPFAGVILCVEHYRTSKKTTQNMFAIGAFVFFFLVFLFWFKNPLVEKRNALGPIYIALIYLFLPKLLNSNVKTSVFMFFSMIVIFPLSAIITHTNSSLRQILIQPRILLDEFEGEGIGEVFNTIHYDAFINITATIDYVKYEGFSYGYQLLSAFLFFIPRQLWPDKPISTGQLVGEHLIDNYGFTYSNLSNPMVSEGYINFGIIGVILLAVLLGYTIVYLLTWLQSNSLMKRMMAFYFAIHLLFFLRGDFANGFSYYIGTLVGVVGIIKVIDYLLKHGMINQHKWKQRHTIKA